MIDRAEEVKPDVAPIIRARKAQLNFFAKHNAKKPTSSTAKGTKLATATFPSKTVPVQPTA